jgi:flagellin
MSSVDVTRVAGNIGALNALNSLSYVNSQLSMHQTRLATGKRINYAYEDPAGLNLATTFDVRRQGLQVALNSIGDSKNMLSTAEGGLTKIQDILVKMKNKAMEAIGDTIGQNERNAVVSQLQEYAAEINNIAGQTQWNGRNLISGSGATGAGDGDVTAGRSFLVDASGGSVAFKFGSNRGFVVGSGTGLGFTTTNLSAASAGGNSARTVADQIDSALNRVKQGVREVGSFMARLTFKEDSLTVQYTNTEAAYNRIMNANMAQEQVESSKYSILQQTATAMLSQANVAPQFILQLFQ